MAERDGYAPGIPSWVDLATSDPAGARDYYTGLFGWDAEVGPDEYGNQPCSGSAATWSPFGRFAVLIDSQGRC